MKPETLAILRCPYCGGRLELVEADHHKRAGEVIVEGILGCHCCTFPVVAGIPVLQLQAETIVAREALEQKNPSRALRALIAPDDERLADRFERLAYAPTTTYRELVTTLGPGFEGGYFLYRFSDPSYVTASAVVGSVAGAVLGGSGRAIDLCGGSGHLTRNLVGMSSTPPVVADLYFAKLWLASRYVAPGCEAVCCDGNAPFPFERGAFSFAMCADAFMYIWTKRQFVIEMLRLIDGNSERSAAVITHAHNQLVWSASHGQPLTPGGYADLFETMPMRAFAESKLLDDVVAGGPLDLSRRDDTNALESDHALTLIASRTEEVFRKHPIPPAATVPGELRLNPLYAAAANVDGSGTRYRLRFPDPDYEEEYGACRRYLDEEVTLGDEEIEEIASGERTARVEELLKRKIVLEMPERYY